MATRQEFIELILEHYENPRNYGTLVPADIVMKGGNPACGDIVTLYLRLDRQSQTLKEITFTGEGCTVSQASASLTTVKVKGRTIEELRVVRAPEILEELGEGVLGSRRRCVTLALHTLRAALTRYLRDSGTTLGSIMPDGEDHSGLQFENQESEPEE